MSRFSPKMWKIHGLRFFPNGDGLIGLAPGCVTSITAGSEVGARSKVSPKKRAEEKRNEEKNTKDQEVPDED